jgi:hypothetical protein
MSRTPVQTVEGLAKLVEILGAAVMLAIDDLADEGGCVYLGDTNHAHALCEAADA